VGFHEDIELLIGVEYLENILVLGVCVSVGAGVDSLWGQDSAWAKIKLDLAGCIPTVH
jgi:hypothetical protein